MEKSIDWLNGLMLDTLEFSNTRVDVGDVGDL